MVAAWITLSTTWKFANVQGGLGLIISFVGIVAAWSFGRVWWQRSSTKVIEKDNVPLSSMLTITTPGEAWDALFLLRTKLFRKIHLTLLFQIAVIIVITVMTTINSFISRWSLRSGDMIKVQEIQGLQAIEGAGPYGNRVSAMILWNTTWTILDRAGFPNDQLLDFLPPDSIPWVYERAEWDPTWRVDCVNTAETPLRNLIPDPNFTLSSPMALYPAFRETFDPKILDNSMYRTTLDWCSWENLNWYTESGENRFLRDAVSWIIVQSEPQVDNQTYKNLADLHFSLTALRLHDVQLNVTATSNFQLPISTFGVIGAPGNASYSRTDCKITRKTVVVDEKKIPWPWTNDTTSIAQAYSAYWRLNVTGASRNNLTSSLPSGEELFRFYQTYMISMGTGNILHDTRLLSIKYPTVELSTVFLAIMVLLFILALFGTARYFAFSSRYKEDLEKLFVPNSKLDWALHEIKQSQIMPQQESVLSDRVLFQGATFGRHGDNVELERPRLTSIRSMSQVEPTRFKKDSMFGPKKTRRNMSVAIDPQDPIAAEDLEYSAKSSTQNISRQASNVTFVDSSAIKRSATSNLLEVSQTPIPRLTAIDLSSSQVSQEALEVNVEGNDTSNDLINTLEKATLGELD